MLIAGESKQKRYGLKDGQTDGRTVARIEGQTDTPSYKERRGGISKQTKQVPVRAMMRPGSGCGDGGGGGVVVEWWAVLKISMRLWDVLSTDF